SRARTGYDARTDRRSRWCELDRGLEPVLKARWAETRVIARREALIVDFNAVVERAWVGGHRPRVAGCAQVFPDGVVEADRFGTGHLDHAVHGFREGGLGHERGDIIRRHGLEQRRRQPNRLPFSRELSDAIYELEELRGADDRVRNRRRLD